MLITRQKRSYKKSSKPNSTELSLNYFITVIVSILYTAKKHDKKYKR